MSYDNPNQCGYYEQETVPCDLCGTPTPMTGTRRCDPCWELERRVEQRPEVAKKLVAAMDAVTNPDTTTQLITRLTEALAGLSDDDCYDACFLRWMKKYEDSDGFEHSEACQNAKLTIAAVAKELRDGG